MTWLDDWLGTKPEAGVTKTVSKKPLSGCDEDFAEIWNYVREQEGALAKEAEATLEERAQREYGALTKILNTQLRYIDDGGPRRAMVHRNGYGGSLEDRAT